MTPFGCLWTGVKIFLSGIFVVLAGLGFVSAIRNQSLQDLAVVAVCGGIAALPWVTLLDNRKRTFLVGLSGIGLAPMLIYVAYQMLIDGSGYPKICSGRRRLGCELSNWLYEVGGTPAVASVPTLFGVMCFIGGVLVVTKMPPIKVGSNHE